eukprot:m.57099 g.57099  ORF g.57099 m.57099 type:complete len:66 (+) comp12085_c0_seq1:419-616(+)
MQSLLKVSSQQSQTPTHSSYCWPPKSTLGTTAYMSLPTCPSPTPSPPLCVSMYIISCPCPLRGGE